MKIFKKIGLGFLKYFGAFLASVVCVASIMIASSLLSKKSNEPVQQLPTGTAKESAVEKIISNLEQMKNGEFDLNVEIASPTMEPIVINSIIEINAENQKEQTQFQPVASVENSNSTAIKVELNVAIGNEIIDVNVAYLNDMLYADFAGTCVKFETSNVLQSIEDLLKLNMFSSLDMGISLSSLDWATLRGMIVGFGAQAKTETYNNMLKTNLDVMGMGVISFITDQEYNLQSIEISEFNFEGIEISGQINAKLNEINADAILLPEFAEKATDVSEIFEIMPAVDALVEKSNISGIVNVEIDGTKVEAKYFVDFKGTNNIKAGFETEIASQILNVEFLNNKVYVTYDDLKYYFDLEEFNIDKIAQNIGASLTALGYELPEMNIEFDPTQLAGLLSYVGELQITKDYVSLEIENGLLKINLENQEFSSISFDYENSISANITLAEEVKLMELNYDEYFNINKFGETLTTVLGQISEKKVASQIDVKVAGLDLSVKAFIDLNNGFEAKFVGSYDEFDFEVIYQEGYIYLNLNELKIKYEIPQDLEIEELIGTVVGLIQEFVPEFELPEIDLEEMKKSIEAIEVEDVISSAKNLEFKIVNASSDNVEVEVNGFRFNLDLREGEIGNLNFNFEGNEVNVNILSNDFEIAHTDDYIRINETLEYIPALIDLIKSEKVELSTTLMLEGMEIGVNVKLDYNETFAVRAELNIAGEKVVIYYANDTIYISCLNNQFKGTIEELSKLLPQAEAKVENQEVAQAKLVLDFLDNITKEGNILNVMLKIGLSLSVEKEAGKITGIGFDYQGTGIEFEVSTFDDEIEYEESGKYLNISELVEFAEIVTDFAEETKKSFTIELSFEDFVVNGDCYIDYSDINNVKFGFATEIASQKLIIEFANNKVYVSYDDLKYFIDLNEINFEEVFARLTDVLAEYGYELPEIEVEEIEIENFIGLVSYVGEISLTEEEFSVAIEKGLLKITLKDETITALSLSYSDIANVSIKFDEEAKTFETNLNEYVNISKLGETINSVINQINEKKVATEITLNVAGFETKVKVYIDLNNGFEAKFAGSYDEFDFEVIYQAGYIYLNLNELKIKYEIPQDLELEELIGTVVGLIQEFVPEFELPEIDLEEVKKSIEAIEVEDLISSAKNLEFKIVNASSDNVEVEVNGFRFNLDLREGEIGNLNFNFEGNEVNVNILSNDFEIAHTDDYIRINETLEYIPALIDLIKSEKVELSTTLMLEGMEIGVNVKLDYNETFAVRATIAFAGEIITVHFVNDTLYIDLQNLHFKGTLAELMTLIEIEEQTNASTELVLDFLKNITQNGNVLNIVLNMGLSVSIEKTNGVVTKLGAEYNGTGLEFDVKTFEEEITYTEFENYNNIVEFVNFAEVMMNFVQNETIAFDVDFTYADFDVNGKIMLEGENITAIFETTIIDRKFKIALVNNQIYVNFDGMKITCAVEDIPELVAYVTDYIGVDLNSISQTITNASQSSENVLANLILKLEKEILNISVSDVQITIDTTENKLNNIQIVYEEIGATLTPCSQFEVEIEENYINLCDMKGLSKAVYNSLKNLSISGTIDVTLNLFGEDNQLLINYAIGFTENKLIGYIDTNFKGLDVDIYLDGEDIYIYIVGLKVHFNINQLDELVDWINNTFEADLSLDFIDDIMEEFENMDLNLIKSLKTIDNATYVQLNNGISLEIYYGDYLETIYFEHESRKATITCTDFNLINLDNLNRNEFRDYTEFTPVIENFYNLIMSSQYDLKADVISTTNGVQNMDIDANLQLDITNGLNAYVDLKGLGEQIELFYEDKTMYFRYAGAEGLKISIEEHAIQEILAILLSAVGFDTSSIPYLNEILEKENIDTDNLGSILPKIELGNPLNYLTYIDKFDITDTYLAIYLKDEMFANQEEGKDVAVMAYYSNGKITSIEIKDLYLSATEKFDITLTINDFEKVTTETNKEPYINISNSKELIKAFVNTSQLKDYHINGYINMNFSIGSYSPTLAAIKVDAKVKRLITETKVTDEFGNIQTIKKDEVVGIVTLDNYPLINIINGVNTNDCPGILAFLAGTRRYRKVSLILKGGYAYLFTDDEGNDDYTRLQRATKIPTEYLLGNIEYYIQYLLGFTDTIQKEIVKAIEESKTYSGPVNYGKMFKYQKLANGSHEIILNMSEIAHTTDIGDLTLTLSTINNESTGNKDYLHRLDLSLTMFDGMMSLSTDKSSDTNALFLTDIGKEVDLKEMNTRIDEYDTGYKLGVDGEYEKEGGYAWKQANTGDTTVTLYNQGSVYATLTGNIGSPLNLPKLTRVEDDGITKREYTFGGWYKDEEFTTPYTSTSYPRYSTNLYAKWTLASEKKYITVNYVTNENSISEQSIRVLEGSSVNLPMYQNIENIISENETTLKIFQGWYIDENCTQKFEDEVYSSNDLTIYALWKEDTVLTYNLDIHYDGKVVYSGPVPGNVEFAFPSKDCFKEDTKYFDFTTNEEITDFTVRENSIWVAKNYFEITVTSIYNGNESTTYSEKFRELNGETLSLPTFQNFTVDKTTYFVEYTFLGYKLSGGTDSIITGDVTFTTSNQVYIAEWSVVEYVYIDFNITWVKPSGWGTTGNKKVTQVGADATPIPRVKWIRNAEFNPDINKYNATWVYNYTYYAIGFVPISADYTFTVLAWNTSGSQSCNFSITPSDPDTSYEKVDSIFVSEHVTLNAVWGATMG